MRGVVGTEKSPLSGDENAILLARPGPYPAPAYRLCAASRRPFGVLVMTAMSFEARVAPGSDAGALSVFNEDGEAMRHTSPLARQSVAIR